MARYTIDNREAEINFGPSESDTDRVLRNCKNLLMTRMGEIPYDRLRGLDPALYHLPIDKMRLALLPEIDRVMAWEPRADVVSADATMDDNNDVIITVIIEA